MKIITKVLVAHAFKKNLRNFSGCENHGLPRCTTVKVGFTRCQTVTPRFQNEDCIIQFAETLD